MRAMHFTRQSFNHVLMSRRSRCKTPRVQRSFLNPHPKILKPFRSLLKSHVFSPRASSRSVGAARARTNNRSDTRRAHIPRFHLFYSSSSSSSVLKFFKSVLFESHRSHSRSKSKLRFLFTEEISPETSPS